MGSYISTDSFVQLPFGTKFIIGNNIEISSKSSDEEIINLVVNSNCTHIQTMEYPSERELTILNEIFRLRPDIVFRMYNMFGDSIDLLFLLKLPNLRKLYLHIYTKITNIEVINKLELQTLSLSCFNVKDYSFLKDAFVGLKNLTIYLEDKTYKMDIANIVHLENLESLSIRNVVKGLDKISLFKNLKSLALRAIKFSDYKFLNETSINKLSLFMQDSAVFDTIDNNDNIKELHLWMNKKLYDVSFILKFKNLEKLIITDQSKINFIPDFKVLTELKEVYWLYEKKEKIQKYFNNNVKIYTSFNPADLD